MCTAIISFLASSICTTSVEQKFFESGHSQSECDSMHSCIEHTFRKKDVVLPSAYQQCMKEANKKMPYIVKECHHSEFLDSEYVVPI